MSEGRIRLGDGCLRKRLTGTAGGRAPAGFSLAEVRVSEPREHLIEATPDYTRAESQDCGRDAVHGSGLSFPIECSFA